MSRKISRIDEVMKKGIGNYRLVNRDKVDRVINGVVGKFGQLEGGLGDDAKSKDILAHYDKVGGLIVKKTGSKKKDGSEKTYKVKIGCFWDIINKKPFEKTKVMLSFRDINGDEVFIPEEKKKELPFDVQAAEASKEKKEAKQKEKSDKAKKTKNK